MEFKLSDDDVKQILKNHAGRIPYEIFSNNLPEEPMPTTSFRAKLIIKYRRTELDPRDSLHCFVKYLPEVREPPQAADEGATSDSSEESYVSYSSSSESSDNSDARFKPKDYFVDRFEHEYAFYKLVYPLLKQPPIEIDFMPGCYLAKNNIIVLEDMRMRGFRVSENKELSSRELLSGVRALARFQCSGIMADQNLAAELGETCNSIDKIHPEALLESIFIGDTLQQMELHIDLAESLARELGLPSQRIRPGLLKGFLDIVNWKDEQRRLKRTICHGNFNPKTVLFDKGFLTEKKCVLTDFQKVHYAPRTLDVIEFIYLSTTKSMRIEKEISVLESYYREMHLCLEACGRPDPEFRYADVVAEYEEVRLSGLLLAVINGPLVWLESAHNPEYTDFDVFYKKIALRTDNSQVMRIFKEKSDFAIKMKELMVDLVDYLERHDIKDTTYMEQKLGELKLSTNEDLDSSDVRDSSAVHESLLNLSTALRDIPESKAASLYSSLARRPSKRASLDSSLFDSKPSSHDSNLAIPDSERSSLDSNLEVSFDIQFNFKDQSTSENLDCSLPELPSMNNEEAIEPQHDSNSPDENVDLAVAEAPAMDAQHFYEDQALPNMNILDEHPEPHLHVDGPIEEEGQVAAQALPMIEEAAGGVDLAPLDEQASRPSADSGAPSSPDTYPEVLEREVVFPPSSDSDSGSSRDSDYSFVDTESSSLPGSSSSDSDSQIYSDSEPSLNQDPERNNDESSESA